MQEDPSELTAVLFDGVDKLQHLCWRFLRPEDAKPLEAEWEFEVRELCLKYFRQLDGLLEKMCALAGPQATVMMASDHGFGPTYEVFHINTWLQQNGYLAWSEGAATRDTEGAVLGVGQVARHTWLLDWSRTTAFATTPTSNGIHIAVNRDGTSPGVPVTEYGSFRRRLVEQLRAFRDPKTKEPIVTEIWTREEAFSGPHADAGPDLTLILRDGGLVSILPAPEPLSQRSSIGGAHRPIGVFAAKGPGMKAGVTAREMSILDVAPTVLYSLGLGVPCDMQGRVAEELYHPEALDSHPVRRVKTNPAGTNGTAHPASVGSASAQNGSAGAPLEYEEAVLDRLRELGYIE